MTTVPVIGSVEINEVSIRGKARIMRSRLAERESFLEK